LLTGGGLSVTGNESFKRLLHNLPHWRVSLPGKRTDIVNHRSADPDLEAPAVFISQLGAVFLDTHLIWRAGRGLLTLEHRLQFLQSLNLNDQISPEQVLYFLEAEPDPGMPPVFEGSPHQCRPSEPPIRALPLDQAAGDKIGVQRETLLARRTGNPMRVDYGAT
jgi:hypothetical protein